MSIPFSETPQFEVRIGNVVGEMRMKPCATIFPQPITIISPIFNIKIGVMNGQD